jgi:hypothetical protein
MKQKNKTLGKFFDKWLTFFLAFPNELQPCCTKTILVLHFFNSFSNPC